ncbi:MAG: DUF499 domain-containing protein [Planctomycetaceae bacterium]|jgi:hypothetical protein|nr:DUF499 domain-containing protein [Planctomycetaceae bacterium]
MPPLKFWYNVIKPREDLRENRPLDASEFAIHLDHVRNGSAPKDYSDPHQFFERTFLTRNLKSLAVEVLRRLSGVTTETSAVFNMSTQFGGGKTHALTLLYHLAKSGNQGKSLNGVQELLSLANIQNIPDCQAAVFVGTEFDSLTGRGGNDGTPLRKTPWGEIAWQIGGETALSILAQHEQQNIAPAGDVLSQVFPANKPVLILMDEIMNFVSRSPNKDSCNQFYNFLQNLSEFARSRSNIVLAVSVPASEIEMNPADHEHFNRIKKLLDRLGKAVIMSVESETSEIIRRRLFEWDNNDELRKVAKITAQHYAEWIHKNRQQIPQEFPADDAVRQFESSYPFHPTVISLFERKWQAISRFQRTRGVLRLLALWVADAYQKGFKHNQADPIIGLGTAPFENSLFRTALFEQLGEPKLEVAVTTDIIGRNDSHAIRLDNEADSNIKKTRLHQKIVTSIFFESNGGQTNHVATEPEIRLAVSEPGLDIGNIETALDALCSSCYYLVANNKKYWFSIAPNLNKLLGDRRASVTQKRITERVRTEIEKVFLPHNGIKRVFFPQKSSDISDEAIITFVVLSPEQNREDWEAVEQLTENWTREHGTGVRRFKNSLVWVVAESYNKLQDDVRNLLAWEDIQTESPELQIDDIQRRQLEVSLTKAKKDVKETIWRTYKNLFYLNKDDKIQAENLGLLHSSSANSLLLHYVDFMRHRGDIEDKIGLNFLIRNWPPALTEWSTKEIKEICFASTLFPRLLKPESILQTLSQGITDGRLAYVGKGTNGKYEPFHFGKPISDSDIEISTDMYIIRQETAESYLHNLSTNNTDLPSQESASAAPIQPKSVKNEIKKPTNLFDGASEELIHRLTWSGEIPKNQWMTFYTKVLTNLIQDNNITLSVQFEITSETGISTPKIASAKSALRELGLNESLNQE